MVEGERLLTVPQVAERLQVGPRTVHRWLREGRLRGFLLGGTKTGYRVRASEVERFVQSREGREAS